MRRAALIAAVLLASTAEARIIRRDLGLRLGNQQAFSTPPALDTTAPSLTGLSNDGTPAKTKTWTWSCSEAPCTYRFVVDTSPTTTPGGSAVSTVNTSQTTGTGTYYLHITALDRRGNESAPSHFSVTLDNTGPTISGLSNDGTATKSKTWTWSCNETCTTRYVVDTSSGGTPSGSYGSTMTTSQSSGDGTYYVHVQAQDSLGNVSSVTTVSALLDNTAPTITGITNDSTPTQSKSWTWGCNETCTTRYLVDGSSGGTPSGSYGATTTTSQSSGDGTYYLHVQAQDSAGNVTSVSTVSAVLDNTGPTLTGLSNDSNPTTSKSWSWGCTDVSTPCTYRYVVDTTSNTTPSGSYGSTTSTSQSSGNATYYLHVQGKDALGNVGSVTHVSAILDNTNPVVTGLSNDSTTRTSKTWTWGCTDASSCTYRFAVDTSSSWTPAGSFSATTTTSQSTGYATVYYVHVQAQDAAGNNSAVVSASVRIDNATFRFAPTWGDGITTSSLAGSKSETATFTRSTSASCFDPITGTMTDKTTNTPCIRDRGDGVLGVEIEQTSTNQVTQSASFDNSAWSSQNNHITSVTANTTDVTDPYGTNTAEKVVFQAAGFGGNESSLGINMSASGNLTNGAWYSETVFARCAVAGCHLYLWIPYDSTAILCSPSATKWTRCERTAVAQNGGTTQAKYIRMGVPNWYAGPSEGAQTIYLFGAQFEDGHGPTSYMGTSGSTGTRQYARLSFAGPTSTSTPSMAATVNYSRVGDSGKLNYWMHYRKDATNEWAQYIDLSRNATCFFMISSSTYSLARVASTVSLNTSTRLLCSYASGTLSTCQDGSCTTSSPSFTPTLTSTTLYIGGRNNGDATTGWEMNGLISDYCFDGTGGGCT